MIFGESLISLIYLNVRQVFTLSKLLQICFA